MLVRNQVKKIEDEYLYNHIIPKELTNIPYNYHIYLSPYAIIIRLCIKFMIRDKLKA